jgi:hypothetical protein
VTNPRSTYKDTVLRVLGKFQLLEFALKEYIARAYRIIAASVQGKVHFDYSEKDVESFALERLLKAFQKLNGDRELTRRLNALREKRNHIAHRALLVTFPPFHDNGEIEDKLNEYHMLEDEVTECVKQVIREAKALKERSSNAA